MSTDIAHRISVDRVDCGSAIASLSPSDGSSAAIETAAIAAFAQHSCGAAISGMSRHIDRIDFHPIRSSLWHLRPAQGELSCAALVDSVLAERLADDIRRNGTMNTRVNLAVVDAGGDAVALGTIEFCVTTA